MSTPMRRTGAAMGRATAATRKRDEVAQTHGNDVARAAEKLKLILIAQMTLRLARPNWRIAVLARGKTNRQGWNHAELNTPSGSHRRRWYCRHNRRGDSQAPRAGC